MDADACPWVCVFRRRYVKKPHDRDVSVIHAAARQASLCWILGFPHFCSENESQPTREILSHWDKAVLVYLVRELARDGELSGTLDGPRLVEPDVAVHSLLGVPSIAGCMTSGLCIRRNEER